MLSILKSIIAFSIIINFLLGLLVFIRNKKSAINRNFFILTIATISWIGVNLTALYVHNLLLIRLMYATGAICISCYLSWMLIFYYDNRKLALLVYAFGLVVGAIGITPMVVEKVKTFSITGSEVEYGLLFPLFAVYILINTVWFFALFFINKRHIGPRKRQAEFVFLGIILFAVWVTFVDIILPILGIYKLYMLDSPGSLFFVGFASYAIVKHRLMDIRLLVLRSVAYTLTLSVIAGIYITVTYLFLDKLKPIINPLALNIVALFILVFTFNPLRRFIEDHTDRLFAKGRYKPAELRRELDNISLTYAREENLIKNWLDTLTDQMKINNAAFVLTTSSQVNQVQAIGFPTGKRLWQGFSTYLFDHSEMLVTDELEEENDIKNNLRDNGVEVLVPIKTKDDMVAMLALGSKKSGDMYTSQDLRLLDDFSSRAVVALERSNEVKKMAALYNQAEKIISNEDLSEVLDGTIDSAFIATQSEGGSIMLYDDKTETLEISACRGVPHKYYYNKVKLGEGIAGRVAQDKELVIIDNEDEALRKFLKRDHINSAICVPLEARGKFLGVLSINRVKNKRRFTNEDTDLVRTVAANVAQIIENTKLREDEERRNLQVINIYISAVEARDPYTKGHSDAVTKYSVEIAKEMGLSEEEVRMIEVAGELHDIGKIGISDKILNKPGFLTDEERALIEQHPKIGKKLIEQYSDLEDIMPIVLHHHERYDGKGYPNGIAGEVIPLGARILAVADTFDAMTSDRPYRKALPLSVALKEIKNNAGTQFDPIIAKVFVKIANKIYLKGRSSTAKKSVEKKHLRAVK
ncbi:MAG: HD domain-containing protein [Actinobacteria bacterium]|nr:MAG: HD domain-containing protein [Actinomycetota bacterium]